MPADTADSALAGLRYYMEQARRLNFDGASEYLAIELAADLSYREAWSCARSCYERKSSMSRENVMEEECYLAIISYTLERPNVCKRFNVLCREAQPTLSSWTAFPFKSLWWFLIRGFEKLPPYSEGSLYRGVDTFQNDLDGSITFGQFVSASKEDDVAYRFGRVVLTLHGVPAELVKDISSYAFYPQHSEVLIWPFCKFKKIVVPERENIWLKIVYGIEQKRLEFVSATPWVERGSRSQVVGTSRVRAAPATAPEATPPKAARTTMNDSEMPDVFNTASSSVFSSMTRLSAKIVQPSVMTDVDGALPEVASSEMESPLWQTTCVQPSVVIDTAPEKPEATSRTPNEGMPELKISNAFGMSPNIRECPTPQLCQVTQKDIEPSKIVDLLETATTLRTMDPRPPHISRLMPTTMKPGPVVEVPETPKASCSLKSPVSHDDV